MRVPVASPRLRFPVWLARLGASGVELVSRAARVRPPFSRGTVAFFTEPRAFSIARAHAELGYTPQVPLSEGVRRTVAWYREQGLLQGG